MSIESKKNRETRTAQNRWKEKNEVIDQNKDEETVWEMFIGI
jgi:hypothetical protein